MKPIAAIIDIQGHGAAMVVLDTMEKASRVRLLQAALRAYAC